MSSDQAQCADSFLLIRFSRTSMAWLYDTVAYLINTTLSTEAFVRRRWFRDRLRENHRHETYINDVTGA